MKPPALFLAVFLLASFRPAVAQSDAQAPQFDYYVLSLSWAPTYCKAHPRDHSSECTPGAHTGFVLHGLWPQANDGRDLEACAPARPVSHAILDEMLRYMPSRGLIQHEWATHGTCSGLPASTYFRQAIAAFTAVHVPAELQNLDHTQRLSLKQLEESFASANQAPNDAFRLSCHNQELVNLEACLDKSLHYRTCGATVRECPAAQVTLPAPK